MGLIKRHDEQQKDTPITQEILRILGELGTKTKVFIVPHTPFLQRSNFQNSTLYIQPSTSMKLPLTLPLKLLLQCNSGVSSQRQGSRPCILRVRSEGSRWPAYGGGTWSGSCDASSALGTLTSPLCARETLRNIPDDMDSCLRDRPTFRAEVTGTWLLWAPTTP